MYNKLFFVLTSGMSKSNPLENFNFFSKDYDSDAIHFYEERSSQILSSKL